MDKKGGNGAPQEHSETICASSKQRAPWPWSLLTAIARSVWNACKRVSEEEEKVYKIFVAFVGLLPTAILAILGWSLQEFVWSTNLSRVVLFSLVTTGLLVCVNAIIQVHNALDFVQRHIAKACASRQTVHAAYLAQLHRFEKNRLRRYILVTVLISCTSWFLVVGYHLTTLNNPQANVTEIPKWVIFCAILNVCLAVIKVWPIATLMQDLEVAVTIEQHFDVSTACDDRSEEVQFKEE